MRGESRSGDGRSGFEFASTVRGVRLVEEQRGFIRKPGRNFRNCAIRVRWSGVRRDANLVPSIYFIMQSIYSGAHERRWRAQLNAENRERVRIWVDGGLDGGREDFGSRAGGEEASEDGRGVSRGPWRRLTSGGPISSMRLDHEEKDRRGFLREIDNRGENLIIK